MALKVLFEGREPTQFDGYDLDYLTTKGGEVGRLMSVPYVYPPGADGDKAAYDAFEGWSTQGGADYFRTVVTTDLSSAGSDTSYRPLFLIDEGTTGYGVVVGTVVGGVAGQVTGSNLGPHTATASGKVTCWDKWGVYAVTLDAVSTAFTTAVDVRPGYPLYATSAGLLTHDEASAFDTSAVATTVVGRFIEFSTSRSLVTTPSYLAGVTSVRTPVWVQFHFRVE